MVLSKPSSSCTYIYNLAFSLLLLLTKGNSVAFNFTTFLPNMRDIHLENDVYATNGSLQFSRKNGSNLNNYGRASYANPIKLWDNTSGELLEFTSHFSFVIDHNTSAKDGGDGITFFLAPFDSKTPEQASGGSLGLFNPSTAFNDTANRIVAVEFDTYNNTWDPNSDHVGIDVDSILSKTHVVFNLSHYGRTAHAWVSYNATSLNLSVFLSYDVDLGFQGRRPLLSYQVDLSEELPDLIRVGLSAATGELVDIHRILSWSFNSTLKPKPSLKAPGKRKGNKLGLVIGLPVSFLALSCIVGFLLLISWKKWKKKKKRSADEGEEEVDTSDIDDEISQGGTAPKRFSYRELCRATNNFAKEGKLGEGGFGGVYKGLLSDSKIEVAVKRVSKDSKQGKKEYIAEVKIISRLRHRNLVKLIGWCHEKGELLLVYEFMPNSSLYFHLFSGELILPWTVRYKIALGLASAVLYLHEEWEECVIHRDIKSSNIMLDSDFNAKLGDFGLARLADHRFGLRTTILAGTLGYLAPEYISSGKASKESDVYSFGVVALEISCGRKPVVTNLDPSQVSLLEWVWELYGESQLFEAVDKRLGMEFDEKEMECLMVVGLWCCHPDPTSRPSIKQVMNALNFEVPLPNLPSRLPVPMYFAPSMHVNTSTSYASSGALAGTSNSSTFNN